MYFTGIGVIRAYAINTWYTIKIHFDLLARVATIFVDNVFEGRSVLGAGDYINELRFWTNGADAGNYNFDIDDLKLFNLTV